MTQEMNIQDVDIGTIIVKENVRVGHGDAEIVQLMQTIRQDGLQSPIGINKYNGSGKYILMYGFRRLLACKKLGHKTIPARIHELKKEDDVLVANLVENLHRRDVTPVELGRICVHLEKLGLTLGEIAARLSKPVSQIRSALTLYKSLPEEFRDKVKYFSTGNEQKKGTIAAHTATNVIRTARTAGLTKKSIGDLMEVTRLHELSSVDIDNIAKLLATGISVTEAVKVHKKYSTIKVPITVLESDLERVCEETGLGKMDLMRAVVYGMVKPFKRPNFIDIKIKKEKKK